MGRWAWMLIVASIGCASQQPMDGTPAEETAITDDAAPAEEAPRHKILMTPSSMPVVSQATPATPPQAAPPPKASTPSPNGEQAAYNTALAAYRKHQPVESIRRFEQFMADHPSSKLMPNALYWKGEGLYLQGNYLEAILQFKDVIAKYPKHPKSADALLKIGMSYKHLGDTENSNLHFRILQEDHPNANAVRLGKQMGLIR